MQQALQSEKDAISRVISNYWQSFCKHIWPPGVSALNLLDCKFWCSLKSGFYPAFLRMPSRWRCSTQIKPLKSLEAHRREEKKISFYYQCIKNEFIILAQQKPSYLVRSFIPS